MDGTKCSVCGYDRDYDCSIDGHVFKNYVSNGDATCTSDGTKTATCEACGVETHTVVDEGSILAHTYNGDWQRDENGHWKMCDVCSSPTVIQEHDMHSGECSVCGYKEIAGGCDHEYSDRYEFNDESHWQICTHCNISTEPVAHTVVDGKCTVCGYSEFTSVDISLNGAIVGTITGPITILRDKVIDFTPVYPNAGTNITVTIGDKIYTVHAQYQIVIPGAQYNGKPFTVTISDAASKFSIPDGKDIILIFMSDSGTNELVENSGVKLNSDGSLSFSVTHFSFYAVATETSSVPGSCIGGHTFGEFVYNNDATCTANGTETATCSVCGTTETRVKAGSMLTHSFGEAYQHDSEFHWHVCDLCGAVGTKEAHTVENGQCTVCGYTVGGDTPGGGEGEGGGGENNTPSPEFKLDKNIILIIGVCLGIALLVLLLILASKAGKRKKVKRNVTINNIDLYDDLRKLEWNAEQTVRLKAEEPEACMLEDRPTKFTHKVAVSKTVTVTEKAAPASTFGVAASEHTPAKSEEIKDSAEIASVIKPITQRIVTEAAPVKARAKTVAIVADKPVSEEPAIASRVAAEEPVAKVAPVIASRVAAEEPVAKVAPVVAPIVIASSTAETKRKAAEYVAPVQARDVYEAPIAEASRVVAEEIVEEAVETEQVAHPIATELKAVKIFDDEPVLEEVREEVAEPTVSGEPVKETERVIIPSVKVVNHVVEVPVVKPVLFVAEPTVPNVNIVMNTDETEKELIAEEPIVEVISEPAVEESAIEELVEEVVEEPAAEEVVEEVIEEPTIEEFAEEIVEEPAVEETVEEVIEEPAAEEVVEEVIEEPAAEEVVEEVIEEPAAEEAVEEVVEEPAAEEAVEEIVEEPAVEEAVEEVIEEPAAEEAVEEVIEEPAAEEAVEEVIEEPAVEEAVEEVIEEPTLIVEEEVIEEAPEAEETVEEAPVEQEATEAPTEDEVIVEVVLTTPEEVEAAEGTTVEEPVLESTPIVLPELSENEGARLINGEIVLVHYRSSFMSRLIQAEADVQDYYTVIKNVLLSYKGVKARSSWSCESYNKGRIQCAKLNIKGRTITLYLALHPKEYADSKYHFTDVSGKPKFDKVPMLVKVRSDRALKYAVELIEEMMRKLEIPQGEIQNVDYHMPYETTEELVARDLVKVILPAGMSLDENANVVKVNVGELIENAKAEAAENAEAETEETTEAPVAEAVEEVVEEPVAEEAVEEIVEEPAAEEAVEEIVEEPAAEEAVEEIIEEPAAEEAVEEIIEEPAAEEAVEEIIEEPATEEAVEEIVEEPAAEEAVEEIVEEPAAEEAVEEAVEVAPVEDEMNVPDEEGRLHVDATHADELVSDEEAEHSIEIIKADAKKSGKMCEVNIDTICENFEDGDTVTLDELKKKRLVPQNVGRLKILARGVMTKNNITVIADKFSLSAVKMINLAGGHAEQHK